MANYAIRKTKVGMCKWAFKVILLWISHFNLYSDILFLFFTRHMRTHARYETQDQSSLAEGATNLEGGFSQPPADSSKSKTKRPPSWIDEDDKGV